MTLRRLADAGARVVLVMATGGELGESRVPLRLGETVPQRRLTELERAAELLGVARLALLGHRDSGLPGWASARHQRALAVADPLRLARRVAAIALAEGATTLIHDDEQGIYGHPDHCAAHRIGAAAAKLVGADAYRLTIARAHLHIAARDGHLVHGAARAAAVEFGRPSVEISLAITGTPAHLAIKRAAMTAHASQIAEAELPEVGFGAAYGIEWFRRTAHRRIGTPGLLDALGNAHLFGTERSVGGASIGTERSVSGADIDAA